MTPTRQPDARMNSFLRRVLAPSPEFPAQRCLADPLGARHELTNHVWGDVADG